MLPVQFGFKEVLYAPYQVCRLVEYVTTAKISKRFTVAIFFDIEKAFDSVWILDLIFKMIKYNSQPTPLPI